MPRPRKVTGEVLERMRELKGEGSTYQEIAGKTGLSLRTVADYMRGKGRSGLKRKFKRTRITQEFLERMAALRRRGLTYEEIADDLGIATITVAKRMRKEGLGNRRRKVTGEVLKRIRDLEKEGVPKKEIADKLNLSYGIVLKCLKREEGLVGKLKRRLGFK